MSLAIVNTLGDIEDIYNIIKDIPFNPSNGDMLMAVFPDLKTEVVYCDAIPKSVRIYIYFGYIEIPYDVWSEKYKRKR